MAITKVFRSGNSQAVRIPREFRIRSKEVEIERRGDEIVLRERPRSMAEALKKLPRVSDDFFAKGRKQPPLEKRRYL